MKRSTQVPGEQPAKEKIEVPEGEDATELRAKKGTTELNNITGSTANTVGAQREDVVRAMAVADAARRGESPDLAPPADIGRPAEPASVKREAIINGQKVMVDIPVVRKNSVVEQFGHESKLPPGTLVNKDGSAHEGAGEAFGVIGNIDTPQGKLVSRVIPFDAVKAAA